MCRGGVGVGVPAGLQGIQEIPGAMALATAGIDGSMRLWKISAPDTLEVAADVPALAVEVMPQPSLHTAACQHLP